MRTRRFHFIASTAVVDELRKAHIFVAIANLAFALIHS
jgi:hypothetical protein